MNSTNKLIQKTNTVNSNVPARSAEKRKDSQDQLEGEVGRFRRVVARPPLPKSNCSAWGLQLLRNE